MPITQSLRQFYNETYVTAFRQGHRDLAKEVSLLAQIDFPHRELDHSCGYGGDELHLWCAYCGLPLALESEHCPPCDRKLRAFQDEEIAEQAACAQNNDVCTCGAHASFPVRHWLDKD